MPGTIQQFAAATLVFWQQDVGQVGPEQFQSGRSLLWMFVQTIFALGFVCMLAYVVLRVLLPRLNVAGAGKSMVHVVDRMALDQRRSLFVIEVTGRWLLVAVSDAGVQLVGELDAQRAEQEAAMLKVSGPVASGRSTLGYAGDVARTAFVDVFARKGKR